MSEETKDQGGPTGWALEGDAAGKAVLMHDGEEKPLSLVDEWRSWCRLAVRADQAMEYPAFGGYQLLDIRIRPGRNGPGSVLLVARAVKRSAKYVAFHAGEGTVAALAEFLKRHEAQGVRWRADEAETGKSTTGEPEAAPRRPAAF